MHEVSIMENVLDIALEQAQKQGATRIHTFKIAVGELSGVLPEALEFAFDVVVGNTLAEGAQLILQRIPVLCYCPSCNLQFQPDNLGYECPQCQQISTQILQGRELELIELEIS